MQKDLLKLALTGLAAGVCLSAQSEKNELAMSKCSRTPTADEMQYPNGQMRDSDQIYEDEVDENYNYNRQDKNPDNNYNPNENPNYNPQSDTCAGSCGHQGDQTSLHAPRLGNYMESKRLSAAKAAIEAENNSHMDK